MTEIPDRRMDDRRFKQIEERLDSGARRLDALDRGQLHMIGQLDEHKDRLDRQDKEIARAADASEETLRRTQKAVELAENMQSAARFFNAVYAAFAWLGGAVHRGARFLVPIVTLALLVWGAIYAWLHGGKPPSAP